MTKTRTWRSSARRAALKQFGYKQESSTLAKDVGSIFTTEAQRLSKRFTGAEQIQSSPPLDEGTRQRQTKDAGSGMSKNS